MGLDAVELVMEVEDHFDLSLENAEAQSFVTVGDLISTIYSRVRMAKESPCLALSFFVKLRRCVRDITGADRLRIRPKDRIADRLSPAERRVLWRRLETLLGYSPLALRRPEWLRWILMFVAVAFLLLACAGGLLINLAAVPGLIILALLGIVVLNAATAPLCTVPPNTWSTFGEITLSLVGTVATTRTDLNSPEEILAELRPIIAK